MRYLAPALIAAAGAIHAQQEVRVSAKSYTPSALTLRAQSDLVEVGVVVRDHNGRAISGLEREDFRVLDQGTPREITTFAVEAAAGGIQSAPNTASASPGAAGQPPLVAARPSRFVALFFDDFSTNTGDLRHAKTAALGFIKDGLDAGDRVAVMASSGTVIDFTADKSMLTASIEKLRPHSRFSESGLTICPRITPYQAYLIAVQRDTIAMHAAIDEAKVCNGDDPDKDYTRAISDANGDVNLTMIRSQAEATWGQARVVSQGTLDVIGRALTSLANTQGRRVLLLASSGFITGTLERERDQLISQALHAGIVINALDAKGLYAEGPVRPLDEPTVLLPPSTFMTEASSLGSRLALANDAMTDFAQGTGGLFFHNNNDLAAGYRLLGTLPDVSYMLGFHPGEIAAEGRYHKLKVNFTASKPYVIQARPGYFALPKTPPSPPDRRQLLDREVMGDSISGDFPASATYLPGGPGVRVQIHVDIRTLQFPKQGERRVQKLEFVVALLDAKGGLVAAKEGAMDFALTDATYERLSASGINAGLNLEVPPGVYRLREVVQEAVDGKMASSVQMIEVK